MPKPLVALVLDNGLFVSVAMRLAQDGAKVLYHTPWQNTAPLMREMSPGTGLEAQGIFRCNDPLIALDRGVDLVVIPDLYCQGFQQFVEEHSEIPVFGPGSGQRLENDRWFLKELLAEHGHDVIFSEEIEGTDALQEFVSLKRNQQKIIKVSLLRGDMETFDPSKGSATIWADDLKRRMGPVGEKVKFIAEDIIGDAIEAGVDTFYDKGRMLGEPILGFEVKTSGVYLGTLDFDFKPFAPLSKTIGDYLANTNYRCFFSNEIRRTKAGANYLIDATTRQPSPPGEVMLAAMKNFTRVAMLGEAPDWGDTRWFAEIALYSDWLAEHWLEITVPDEYRRNFAFRCYCRVGGKDWAIPQDSKDSRLGSAVGWGKSREEAIGMAEAAAGAVRAHHLDFNKLDIAVKAIGEAAAYGITVGK